jgi:hypothetical protein
MMLKIGTRAGGGGARRGEEPAEFRKLSPKLNINEVNIRDKIATKENKLSQNNV